MFFLQKHSSFLKLLVVINRSTVPSQVVRTFWKHFWRLRHQPKHAEPRKPTQSKLKDAKGCYSATDAKVMAQTVGVSDQSQSHQGSEKFEKENIPEVKTSYEYITELRERLEESFKLAQ